MKTVSIPHWSTFTLLPALAGAALLLVAGLTGCSKEPSTPQAAVASADEGLWCKEHGVEEKYCVLCHPEIQDDPDLLLCKEHGNIPEAICTACHPELKEKYEACPHDLPKAFCPECSPEFAAFQKGESTGSPEHDHDDDHQHEESGNE